MKQLLCFDVLSTPVPTFNIKGKGEVRSYLGSIVSILIISTTFLFSVYKLGDLLSKKNPSVIEIEDTYAIPSDEKFYIDEHEQIQIAVGLKNFRTGFKNDPRYI